jgi:hypothetical protein
MKNEAYNPELENITRKLAEISNYFSDYRKKVKPSDDHIIERLNEIENSLDEAVHEISGLVAIEFKENVYYKTV